MRRYAHVIACQSSIFHDSFYLYSSAPKEGAWFHRTIRSLDFFPLLRFMHSLTTLPRFLEIAPKQVHVKYDDTDEARDRILRKRNFENGKRLIELH
jgi:hypothetical protein